MRVESNDIHKVYSYLFREGVLVSYKDFTANHPVFKIPNLQVVMLMKSLKSRDYVKETMNWRVLYWTLTDKGIEYLRDYLLYSEDKIPVTLEVKKTAPRREEATAAAKADAAPKKTAYASRKPDFKN